VLYTTFRTIFRNYLAWRATVPADILLGTFLLKLEALTVKQLPWEEYRQAGNLLTVLEVTLIQSTR
jgi:hypothetical protein